MQQQQLLDFIIPLEPRSIKSNRVRGIMLFNQILAGLLAGAAYASPAARYIVHEKRSILNDGTWSRVAKVPTDFVLPVRVALAQSNMDKGHDWLMEVSDPSSPKYGQHWTPAQLADAFKPSNETVNAVKSWLTGSGIAEERVRLSKGSNWLHLNATVREAEALFKAEFFVFEHESGIPHIACNEYSLPEHIKKHVDFVTPTVHMDAKVKRSYKTKKVDERSVVKRSLYDTINIGLPGNNAAAPKMGAVVPDALIGNNSFGSFLANCSSYIVPNCLRALYGFNPNSASLVNGQNSYGIVEYTPQNYVPTDLDLWYARWSGTRSLAGTRPSFVPIDGGYLVTADQGFSSNGESNLDLMYGIALVAPQPVTLYQVGDNVEGASFNDFLDAFDASYCAGDDPNKDAPYPDFLPGTGAYTGPKQCGEITPARVISTSYAYNEFALTPAYEMRQCNEYLKFGLLGTTFIYSSGDYGVGGNSGRCINATKTGYTNGTSGYFNPSFPGTCPYITAAGATQVIPGTNIVSALLTKTQPEMACETVIYSGGGFSNVFPLPSYQSSAVKNWFAQYPPPYGAERFNNSQTTRGFPDISANGANYIVVVQGGSYLVYGTSASAPVLGAMFTLINQARMNAGKSTIGFINPVLYANPSAMNDITIGGNQGCGTAGFSSAPGWDPVTGLGTPNFSKLQAAFMALP